MIRSARDLKIEDIKVGDKAQFKVKITGKIINSFAKLSGDYNPLHMDERYVRRANFGGRVAHGLLVSSFFSTLIGMQLPGRNSLIVSQETRYIKPVLAGDMLEIRGEVKDLSFATRLIKLQLQAFRVKEKEVAVSADFLVLIRQ